MESVEVKLLQIRQRDLRLMIYNSSQNIPDLHQQRSEYFEKSKLLKRQAYHQQIHHLIDEMETATQAACFQSLRYVCSNWKH